MGQREINRREAGVDDVPGLLSAPTVLEPLYRCATAVGVLGGVGGATIEVEVNGTIVASAVVQTVLPYGITIGIPSALNAGDQVRARQTLGTATSAWSAAATARDHTADYPAGPPRPEISPAPVYECGIRTGVANLLTGGNVWITANGTEVGRVNGCGNPQGVNVAPAYGLGQQVRAWFELCSDPSPPSTMYVTTHAATPLPTPIVAPQYSGSDTVEISNIVNGAKVTVKRNGTMVGTWGCWGGSIRIGGNSPLFSAGEVVEAFQTMCPSDPASGSGSTTVQPCSALPAPQIGPIQGGDDRVTFTQYVSGAVLSVYVNGVQAGKGGGPTVTLNRIVKYGDTVVVAQDLPGCRGQRALLVNVPCVDAPVAGNPSALDLFPVSRTDFSQGPNRGRIYYPAQDDGVDQPFNARLAALGRVPLVVMAHGNHDPNTPSYLGYDYFQQQLARMGFVAVSVDCNAQNGMGYSVTIIERRADLIIGAIAVMQQLDASSGSLFFERIDFSRVGLMGHSQGGEAVVLVPEVISLTGVTIQAVLSLAPTEGGATSRTPNGYAFMTILPASDGDVWPNDGAIFYDRARPSPFKSQLFVHFTNHQFYNRQWLDDDSLWGNAAPTPPVLARYEHERVLSAYGCAFFRARLLGHATTTYLSGTSRPSGTPYQHVYLSFQLARVTTVDNHEDGNGIGLNSLPAPTHQLGGLSADEFRFEQGGGSFNGSFFGASIGMVARAGGNGRLFVQELGGARNLRNREVWIRVAEVYDGRTTSGMTTGFQLGVRDVNGAEAWVDSDDVGGVPRPFPRNPSNMKTMLRTLRFKSECYNVSGRLDLSRIAAVLVRCNRTDERALAFDDLQIVPR